MVGSGAGVEAPVVAEAGHVQLLWHAREQRGARTLAEASRLTGINRDELRRIERGETVQIRFETLAKLVEGYRCTLADLIEVVPMAATSAAPWAGPLAALHAGRLRAGAPGRPDPDALPNELVLSAPTPLATEQFAEPEHEGVRRGAFSPSR